MLTPPLYTHAFKQATNTNIVFQETHTYIHTVDDSHIPAAHVNRTDSLFSIAGDLLVVSVGVL